MGTDRTQCDPTHTQCDIHPCTDPKAVGRELHEKLQAVELSGLVQAKWPVLETETTPTTSQKLRQDKTQTPKDQSCY
jgi:hypothetical protein